jgi:hypothetical protein
MMTMRTVEYSYQIALKAEEKLAKNQSQGRRSRGPNRGKGIFYDKAPKTKDEIDNSYGHIERGGSS